MEDLIKKQENSSDEEIDIELEDDWKISINKEKLFWQTIIIPHMVYIPNNCPYCYKKTIRLAEKQKSDIINPYYLLCNNKLCKRKKSIRVYSFLNCAKLIPASVVYEIICLFLIEMKNGKEIETYLKSKYEKIPNYSTILKILKNIRCSIAEFIKHRYKKTQIGGAPEENKIVAIDESLISHEQNKQIWLVGAIDTSSKSVRIEIIPERNRENLKCFVKNHIIPGTHLTHDQWPAYSFLDDEDSVWTHECHSHGHGDFGLGLHSTSHIEQYWGRIKSLIKKIYTVIPKDGIIYYVKEAEFRSFFNKDSVKEKENLIFKLFKEVYDICQFNYSSESEIRDFNNYN